MTDLFSPLGLDTAYVVYVRSYLRCRFGSWETVTSHYRRLPRN